VAVCLIAKLQFEDVTVVGPFRSFLLHYLVTLVSASVNHQMKLKILQYKIMM